MDVYIRVALYLSLSYAISLNLANMIHYFSCRFFKIALSKNVVFFDVGFNLFKIEKNGLQSIFGWIPLGAYVKPDVSDDEIVGINAKLKKVGPFVFLVLTVVFGWLINFDFSFISKGSSLIKLFYEFSLAATDFDSIKLFFVQTAASDLFLTVLAFCFFFMFLMQLIQISEHIVIKVISFVLIIPIFYFFYKVITVISLSFVAIALVASYISSFLLFLLSTLIIRNK